MADYLVLIYTDEAAWERADAEMADSVLKEHMVFQERNGATVGGGEALERSPAATSIRKDGSGGFVITDGPFAETKEALAGYYRIEAADLDEALAVAKQVPQPFGGVEVRPIRRFD